MSRHTFSSMFTHTEWTTFSPFFVRSSVESQNQPIYYQKAFDKGKRNFLILLRKCKLTKLGSITNNVVKYSPSILNKVSNNNLPNLFCRKLLKSHLTMLRRDFFEIGANFENYYKSQNKNHWSENWLWLKIRFVKESNKKCVK